jgi:cysteinyl-tRNA synthetase
MNKFNKASLLAALFRFRQELSDLNIDDAEKLKLLEEFKEAYSRSLDEDLAMDAIYSHLMSAVRYSHRKPAFKSQWENMNKGFWSQFAAKSEEKRARQLIDNSFRNGMSEDEILQTLVNEGMSQKGSILSPRERDIIRMLVIDEKVRMRDAGVVKMINKFIYIHGR